MQKMEKKVQQLVSILTLASLVFGLSVTAFPKQAKADNEEFVVGFYLENSNYNDLNSNEGLTNQIQVSVVDTGLGGVQGDIEVSYQIDFSGNLYPATVTSLYPASADDFTFNGSNSISGTITIPAGSVSTTFPIENIDDILPENQESFVITLQGALMSGGSGNVRVPQTFEPTGLYRNHMHFIVDNDKPELSIATAAQGGSTFAYEDQGQGTFKVLLSDASSDDVTFDWYAQNNTADSSDYSIAGGHITIPAGETSTTLSIGVVNDDLDEADNESVTIILSNPVNAVLRTNSAALYYIVDDEVITVSFQNGTATVVENNVVVPIVVNLNFPSSDTITANLTIDNATTASTPGDYIFPTSQVEFAPGQTSTIAYLEIINDNLSESDEYIQFVISSATNGSNSINITNPFLYYTIQDDGDTSNVPTLNLTSATASGLESEQGSFTVSMDAVSATDVTFQWKTDAGTASLVPTTVGSTVFPADYAGSATFATATIPAGSLSTTISLGVNDDSLSEQDETVEITIANADGAAVGSVDNQVYTIYENDFVNAQFESADSSGSESTGSVNLNIVLPYVVDREVKVYVENLVSSTATFGTDWSMVSGTVAFAPGETSKPIGLTIVDDGDQESAETAIVAISGTNMGGVSGLLSHTYTINANDAPSSGGSGSGGGGGGSGGGSGVIIPTAPTGSGFVEDNHSVRIESVNTVGDLNFANLVLSSSGAVRMSISNNPEFDNASMQAYGTNTVWKLTSGSGVKTVYVKFFNNAGFASKVASATVRVGSGSSGEVLGVRISLIDELIAKLKFGQTNDEVKQLQTELQKAGFFPANFKPTRYYGSMTRSAVAKYLDEQAQSMTLDELIKALRFGQRGLAVRRLQAELQKLGFFPSNLQTTGYFGQATKAAVAKYLASK